MDIHKRNTDLVKRNMSQIYSSDPIFKSKKEDEDKEVNIEGFSEDEEGDEDETKEKEVKKSKKIEALETLDIIGARKENESKITKGQDLKESALQELGIISKGRKPSPVGTVDKYGYVKQSDGSWKKPKGESKKEEAKKTLGITEKPEPKKEEQKKSIKVTKERNFTSKYGNSSFIDTFYVDGVKVATYKKGSDLYCSIKNGVPSNIRDRSGITNEVRLDREGLKKILGDKMPSSWKDTFGNYEGGPDLTWGDKGPTINTSILKELIEEHLK